ncbi:MAG: SIMPL domain-containing protein [Candidatus Paceibacterota bacterium]|jgi:hypothetical protein|nr:SIMPL domain-containing protein [Candidatus Paceibacterota bacterium]
MDELFKNKKVVQVVIMLLFASSLYLVGLFVNNVKQNGFIGRDIPALTTISVSGQGEAFAKPDIAELSFSVEQTSKTVAEAQKISTDKINAIMAYLKDTMKVKDADIKTTDYSVYPKYEYQKAVACLDYNMNGFCPEGKQILTGYTVSQSVSVKVRKIDDAGAILVSIGEKGATNVSGLTFTVDAKKDFEAKARDNAIKEAQEKADKLAKSLGVTLTRITNFSEGGATPIFYGLGAGMAKTADMAMERQAAAPAPTISTGENKFVSNVTITYEIQ